MSATPQVARRILAQQTKDGRIAQWVVKAVDLSAPTAPSYTIAIDDAVGAPEVAGVRSLVPLVAWDRVWVQAGPGDQPIIINHLDSGWHFVDTVGEPPFQNGFQNYEPGLGYANPIASFRKTSGLVVVQGLLKRPAGNPPAETCIFVLPPGYRPRADQHATNVSSGGNDWTMRVSGQDYGPRAGFVDVSDRVPNATWLDIHISFVAEA